MSSLGRFQHGDRVVVEVVISPVLPDDTPVLDVVDSGESLILRTGMSYAPGITGFRLTVMIGAEYGLGTYTTNVTYSVAGVGQSVTATFEVVAGGDTGGPIISLYSYDRPEGRYGLAQLQGGRLVQGRNPQV